MSNSDDPSPTPQPARARHWHPLAILARCLWALLLGLAAVAAAALWWLSSQTLELGPGLRDGATSRLAPMLAAPGSALSVERLAVGLRQGLVPAIDAGGLALTAPGGNRITLDNAELLLDLGALFTGRLAPRALRIDGMTVAVTRAPTGDVTVALGDTALLRDIETPGALVARLEEVLARPPLTALTAVGATRVSLQITDAVTGGVLQSADADFSLNRAGGRLDLVANLGQIGGRAAPGSARVELRSGPGGRDARLRLALRGIVPARLEGLTALGAQADLLDRIDAPLSLVLEGSLDADGGLGTLSGRATAGSGRLTLTAPLPEIALTSASAAVRTEDGGQRFDLTELQIDTDVLALSGRGGLNVLGGPSEGPENWRVTAQLALREITIDAGESLPGILRLENVATDARVTIAGDRLDLEGHADLLFNGDRLQARLHTSGPGGAGDPGRRFALDVRSATISRDNVFALWPIQTFPRTRQWLDENITAGRGHDMAFSLRLPGGGAPPAVSLNFGYSDATIRFLGSIAPLQGASGRATLENKTFRLEIDDGQVTPGDTGAVGVRPSMMVVPDVTRRPGLLNLALAMEGPTAAFLTVLSNPPFKNDADAPDLLPPDQATGRTDITSTIEVPLGEGGGMKSATFAIAGRVTDFSNDTLLEGRRLVAPLVSIAADETRLAITSDATLDGAPLAIGFARDLDGAPGGAKPPVITASGPLTAALAEAAGVPVPPGLMSGAGRIDARIVLAQDGPPQLSLDADLAGLGLSVPQVGLRKGASEGGRANVVAALSRPPRVERISLDMPGAQIEGRATLAPGGVLARIDLSRLELGGWLSARGSFRPSSGNRRARLEIDGGSLDLRRRPAFPDAGGGAAPDVTARLDRVTISDGLQLTGLRASLPGAVGATGMLSAAVNGIAPFRADLVRRRAGLAGVLRSDDAGALLAAANLFSRARGGRLDLSLVPTGVPGTYDGRLQVTGGSLHGAGTAASIVSALSVVGAIEQMSGEGIAFSEIGARFTLAPGQLRLREAFAEGPSLGLSLDGAVNLDDQSLALQGAVSPIFFVNRLGGPRRGEGLIAVAFRVTGSTRAPEVRVLPLSLLTPGTTRDAFRQPAARAN